MATPDEIVATYRGMTIGTDAMGDSPENLSKIELLQQLDEHANVESVAELLLDIIASTAEFDLARIEAIKILGIYVGASCTVEHKLKRQLWNVLANVHDDLVVRQHASQHIETGFGGPDEQQMIERLLFDDEDDEDVRHGALSYLESTPDIAFAVRLIPKLREHPYWQTFDSTLDAIARR